MGRKLITDAGKNELLRLGFKAGNSGAFHYMALGTEGSAGAQGGNFFEISTDGYERAETQTEEPTNKEIIISATFDETNNADGKTITEIGLCNAPRHTSEEVFFMYSEVPNIPKEDNISLQYTIIMSIE